jgi:hypothetical protein
MGAHATLIAVGPYKKGLEKFAECDPSYYENVPEGCLVKFDIYICNTAAESDNLAQALDINPEQAQTWILRFPGNAPALAAAALRFSMDHNNHPAWDRVFKAILELGTLESWKFFYDPND